MESLVSLQRLFAPLRGASRLDRGRPDACFTKPAGQDRLMRLLAAIVCVLLIPVAVSGQENDDLRDGNSSQQSVREVAAAAARTNEAKAAFVAALRRFVEGLPGGGDRPQIRAAVSDMRAALARWDGAIRNYRVALNGVGDGAEGHVALGTMYLDRGLTPDALDQFRRATTISTQMG